MATGQKQESVEKQLAVTAPRKRKREETLTMKSRTFCIFGLATMLVSSAWAQLANPVKASVPFAFAAGNTKLAAGEYTVKAIQHGVLKLEDASGKNAILLMVIPASRPATSAGPALIFHRYGRFYFLSQVWGDGSAGIQLRKAAAERELAKATEPEDARVVAQNR